MVFKKEKQKEGFIRTSENLAKSIGTLIGLKFISGDEFFYDFQNLKKNKLVKTFQEQFYLKYNDLFNGTYNKIGRKYFSDITLTYNEQLTKTIKSLIAQFRRLYLYGIFSTNVDISDFAKYIKLSYNDKFRGILEKNLYHKYIQTISIRLPDPQILKTSEIYKYIYGMIGQKDFERNIMPRRTPSQQVFCNNVIDLNDKLKHDLRIMLENIPYSIFSFFSFLFHIKYEVYNQKNGFYKLREFITTTNLNDNKKRLKTASFKSRKGIREFFNSIMGSMCYWIYESNILINFYKK